VKSGRSDKRNALGGLLALPDMENRMKGNTLDVWRKAYNNTVTGKSEYVYPEFKGYYKGF